LGEIDLLLVMFYGAVFSVCLCVSAYPAMSMWLNKTGRPILYSCSWPAYQEGHMIVSFKSENSICVHVVF